MAEDQAALADGGPPRPASLPAGIRAAYLVFASIAVAALAINAVAAPASSLLRYYRFPVDTYLWLDHLTFYGLMTAFAAMSACLALLGAAPVARERWRIRAPYVALAAIAAAAGAVIPILSAASLWLAYGGEAEAGHRLDEIAPFVAVAAFAATLAALALLWSARGRSALAQSHLHDPPNTKAWRALGRACLGLVCAAWISQVGLLAGTVQLIAEVIAWASLYGIAAVLLGRFLIWPVAVAASRS